MIMKEAWYEFGTELGDFIQSKGLTRGVFADQIERQLGGISREILVNRGRVQRWIAGKDLPTLIEFLAIDKIWELDDETRQRWLALTELDQQLEYLKTLISPLPPATVPEQHLLPDLPALPIPLTNFIQQQVTSYAQAMTMLLMPRQPIPRAPYKNLDSYGLEDAGLFFGREEEIERICDLAAHYRLTILHGKSGSGKTSLLEAGMGTRLIEQRWLPVYARTIPDPVVSIKQALVGTEQQRAADAALEDLSLYAFLKQVTHSLHYPWQGLVVILDQFEEFFIHGGGRYDNHTFIKEFQACYRAIDPAFAVHFVISVRKDYFSECVEFLRRSGISSIQHHLFLQPMARDNAIKAITGPLEKILNRHVVIEPALLSMLLDDLEQNGSIELPQLQIICSKLYASLSAQDTMLTGKTYEALGKTSGILQRYLDEELDKLPQHEQVLARELLKELVSSESTRRSLPLKDLLHRLKTHTSNIQDVLNSLVASRLLRTEESKAGSVIYELMHEYLIDKISQWITEDDIERKRVEEMLSYEVRQWRLHPASVIERERLKSVYTQRNRLHYIDEDTALCLLHSGLAASYEVQTWVEMAGERGERILIQALESPQWEIRRATMQGLGVLWQWPEISQLGDKQNKERIKALRTFTGTRDKRLTKLLAALLLDPDEGVAWEAFRLLRESNDVVSVIPQLKLMLRHVNHHTRLYVAEILGASGSRESTESLLELLEDADQNIRYIAIQSLGRIWGIPTLIDMGTSRSVNLQKIIAELEKGNDPRLIRTLITILPHEKSPVQLDILEALGKAGKVSDISYLLQHLNDADVQVCIRVVQILGDVGNKEAVEPLLILLRDRDMRVHLATIQALGKLKDERAITPILFYLYDQSATIRWAVIQSLSSIWEFPELSGLGDSDFRARQQAARNLGNLGDKRAVSPLMSTLADAEASVRQDTVQALGKLGDKQAVELLIHTLTTDENNPVRLFAAQALGKLNDLRAVKPLINVFNNSNSHMRQSVVQSLGNLGDKQAVDLLIHALTTDENHPVRQYAAEALGKLGDDRAIPPLLSLLHPNNPKLVRSVVLSLSALWGLPDFLDLINSGSTVQQSVLRKLDMGADPPIVEPLLTLLEQGDMLVRSKAATILAHLGYDLQQLHNALHKNVEAPQSHDDTLSKINDLVYNALHNEKTHPRHRSAEKLGKLGDERAVVPLRKALIEQDDIIRARAAWALGQLGSQLAVDPLIEALTSDPVWKVRHTSAVALGLLGSKRAFDPLIHAALQDSKTMTRKAAAEALVTIDSTQAAEIFTKALHDEDSIIRQRAIRALNILGHKGAIDSIAPLLKDPDSGVRQMAEQTLRKFGVNPEKM